MAYNFIDERDLCSGKVVKIKPKKVEYGFGNYQIDIEGRLVRVYFKNYSVLSVYFPSGSSGEKRQEFKFMFLDFFFKLKNAKMPVSLNEFLTPLVTLDNVKNNIDFKGDIIVKDESYLPTASFKARGLCLAVSMAKQLGIKHMAIPTNGNAGAALAAYCARANIKCTVFCPEDTPEINIKEINALGADTYLVNGFINECGKIVFEGKEETGWFDVSTLKEPYRIEGKKTMGLELAEQFNWELPDVIFYPTGGGTGLIGMWKAFNELEELGWISKKPRMVAVQSDGCAPIYKAWKENKEFADLWENPKTVASGIRVPIAVGDFLIIRALNESNGFSITVSDEEILNDRDFISKQDGLLMLSLIHI